MPANIVKSLIKKSGKSEKEVEKAFDKGTEIYKDDTNKKDKDLKDKDYKIIYKIVSNILGIKESFIKEFLESDLSAKEYFNESTEIEEKADKFLLFKKPSIKDIKVDDIVAYQDTDGEFTKTGKVTQIKGNIITIDNRVDHTPDELRIKESKESLSKTFYDKFKNDILRKYDVKNYKKKGESGKKLAVIDVISDQGFTMDQFNVDSIINLIDWKKGSNKESVEKKEEAKEKKYKYVVQFSDNTYTVFYDDEKLSDKIIKKVVSNNPSKVKDYTIIDMTKSVEKKETVISSQLNIPEPLNKKPKKTDNEEEEEEKETEEASKKKK